MGLTRGGGFFPDPAPQAILHTPGAQDVPGFARIFCTARTFRKQASGVPFRHKKNAQP